MIDGLGNDAARLSPAPAAGRVPFETLLDPVLPLAYGVALRLSRNRDDAEDLVQEAALQALRGYGTFQPGTNFKAWFIRILTHCFYARYRKKRRQPVTIDLDDAPPLYLMTRLAGAGSDARREDPAAALLDRMDVEQVAEAIAALADEYRVVTTLYFLDDLSYQEIADILDCPMGTVRSRLHRGRRMLQKALWHVAVANGIVAEVTSPARE